MNIRYADVLDKALENNSFALNIRRRQLESDYAVQATAKGNLRSIKLSATVGYSGMVTIKMRYAYDNMKNNAIISVGFSILVDWGKRRGRGESSWNNREVTESKLRQEQQAFNQNIFLLVEHFNNQNKQLNIATEADSIAQKRYKTSIETFMIGKINTLDLNNAQVNKDEARQTSVNSSIIGTIITNFAASRYGILPKYKKYWCRLWEYNQEIKRYSIIKHKIKMEIKFKMRRLIMAIVWFCL